MCGKVSRQFKTGALSPGYEAVEFMHLCGVKRVDSHVVGGHGSEGLINNPIVGLPGECMVPLEQFCFPLYLGMYGGVEWRPV